MNLDDRILFDKAFFDDVKQYFDGGNTSITYVGNLGDVVPDRQMKKNEKYYFKANNARGINTQFKTDEARGSCEDVGEVLSSFIINNLNQKCGVPIVPCAKYFFSEMISANFKSIISKRTAGVIESDRLYGCLSENVIGGGAYIIRGNFLLSLLFEGDSAYSSSNNTLYNYFRALNLLQESEKPTFISPEIMRSQADFMFVDYFLNNSDRHCKNINFQRITDRNGKFMIVPAKLIDNGACFGMQHPNCFQNYLNLKNILSENNGKFEKPPFDRNVDYLPGREVFVNEEDGKKYDQVDDCQKLVMFFSKNRILFNDFKAIYENINVNESYDQMYYNTCYNQNFLPDFKEIISASIDYKKMEISQAIAKELGVEFVEQEFNDNQNFYIDAMDNYMQENQIVDQLTIPIATKEEIQNFNDQIINEEMYQ